MSLVIAEFGALVQLAERIACEKATRYGSCIRDKGHRGSCSSGKCPRPSKASITLGGVLKLFPGYRGRSRVLPHCGCRRCRAARGETSP